MDPRRHLLRNAWITLLASFALAAVLALPGRAGAAVDIDQSHPLPPFGPVTGSFPLGISSLLSGSIGNTFLDHFTLTVLPSNSFTLTTTPLFQSGVTLTGTQLFGPGPTLIATTGSPFITSTPTLFPGTYDLHVSGTLTASSAIYGVSVNFSPTTAPIPEPETYAMMLAGLGLMGFVARRGKQKKAA